MIAQISKDIIAALKAKDKALLTVLRSLKSAVQYQAIEKGTALTDAEVISVLQSQVKSRIQAIELYRKGGRDDLAEQEEREVAIIKRYLPTPLTADELEVEVAAMVAELHASSMKDMGSVMRALKEKLGSRAEGKALSSLVRGALQ